jgi:hypothetical protein
MLRWTAYSLLLILFIVAVFIAFLWPKAAEVGMLGVGYAYALWLFANTTYKSIRK